MGTDGRLVVVAFELPNIEIITRDDIQKVFEVFDVNPEKMKLFIVNKINPYYERII